MFQTAAHREVKQEVLFGLVVLKSSPKLKRVFRRNIVEPLQCSMALGHVISHMRHTHSNIVVHGIMWSAWASWEWCIMGKVPYRSVVGQYALIYSPLHFSNPIEVLSKPEGTIFVFFNLQISRGTLQHSDIIYNDVFSESARSEAVGWPGMFSW